MCSPHKGYDSAWADLQSDDEVDSACEQRSTDDEHDRAKGNDSLNMPSLADAMTQSLLIQSFNATSRANSVMTSTEHLSPENSESPSTIVWQPHSTTVGFNPLSTVPEAGMAASTPAAPPSIKVSVPIAPSSGRTHGYAGLLGAFGSNEQPSERAPCLSAVDETHDAQVTDVLGQAQAGIAAGRVPEAALDGMGGTYFLCSSTGNRVAIFKPCDEEPLAPNNPKQWQGRAMGMPGMKPSVRVGEAALREVAAYLLDHDAFAGVPAACLAKCYHPALNYKVQVPRIESLMNVAAPPAAAPVEPYNFAAAPAAAATSSAESALLPVSGASEVDAAGAGGLSRVFCRKTPPLQPEPAPVVPSAPGARKLGSLQRYVPSKCDANDMSPSFFSADNVHRVGLLDLRLFNCDRHTGNLLVQEGTRSSAAADTAESFPRRAPYTIIPIDHGYALPEALDNPYFEWLFWPQTSVPFSEAVKAYVAGLDAATDVAKLRAALPQLREECFRCLETTTIVLQQCVAAGLTLFEIGSIFTRPEGCAEGQVPSDLEALCMDAREEALNVVSEHNSSSGNTSPSQPGSPVSFGFNVHSANTLPAVEECDSDEDSGCLFNLSAGGEYPRSPRQIADAGEQAETAELSPLMFPMTPRDGMSGGSGAAAGGGDSAQGPAESGLTTPAAQLSNNARFCSLPFATPAYLRHGNMSSDGDAMPTPAPAQSASGVALSQAPATWGRRGLPRARRNAWRSKHGAQRNMPAYPSLLPGTHPDQVNYVFSDLSDAQWTVFVQKLEEYVQCELASNTWKTQRMTGCMAGSCPVAFTRHMQ